MIKIKVLKNFRLKAESKAAHAGEELEISDERVKELEKGLKKWGGGFFEVIEEKTPVDEEPEDGAEDEAPAEEEPEEDAEDEAPAKKTAKKATAKKSAEKK